MKLPSLPLNSEIINTPTLPTSQKIYLFGSVNIITINKLNIESYSFNYYHPPPENFPRKSYLKTQKIQSMKLKRPHHRANWKN